MNEKIERSATPLKLDFSLEKKIDVVILELNEVIENIEPFDLVNLQIPYNIVWNSFGYPSLDSISGKHINGKIEQILDKNSPYNWDVILSINSKESENLEGFSGSPLIINNKVNGVIIVQNSNSIGVVSINKLRIVLDENKISYINCINKSDIPDIIMEDIKKSIPNYNIFNVIENKILQNNNNYIFLKGVPGIGKTTIVSSFIPNSDNIVICGRYIIKIPGINYYKRTSEEVFVEWFDNCISKVLTGYVADIKNINFYKYIEIINNIFIELDTFLKKNNNIGVFFIDGLEEVIKFGNINKFLSILPETLLENIKFIFSFSSLDLLPDQLRKKANESNTIIINSMSKYDSEKFIYQELKSFDLTYSNVSELAVKSEGHPLYLRYLTRFVNENYKDEDISILLSNIPKYDTDIKNYYDNLWNEIKSFPDKIWIIGTIANLREGIAEQSLINLLPEQTRYTYISYFPSIKHLLSDNNSISIYHSSLVDFILEKTKIINKDINKNISDYCLNNPDIIFSLRNLIHHLTKSSVDNIKLAITLCNQDWIDRCALEYIEPDIIINDVAQILNLAFTEKKTVDVIRLLFLLQRLKFRYDDLFAKYAANVARVLFEVKQPSKAINYIVRYSTLIVSNEDALYFLNLLCEKKMFNEARNLFEIIRDRYINTYKYYYKENKGIPIEVIRFEIESNSIFLNCEYKISTYKIFNIIEKLSSNLDCKNEKDNETANYLCSVYQAYLLWNFGNYVRIKDILNNCKFKDAKNFSELLSFMILHYKEYSYSFYKNKNYNKLISVIEDLEYLIENFGIKNNKIGIEALIENSNKVNIVEKLIENLPFEDCTICIRKENGVDVNWDSIDNALKCYKYKGYTDKKIDFLDLPDLNNENWEEWIKSLIKILGLLFGRAYRIKAEEDTNKKEQIIELIKDYIFDFLNFNLEKRIQWERSYGIPEEIFPRLYGELAYFFVIFCPEEISFFIEILEKRSTYQLGLYTEGFRDILFAVINNFLLADNNKLSQHIFKLLLILEKHIEIGVLNRWERTHDFLRLIELFGKINCQEKAKKVYKKMLDTSMGISWYKEDQLSLISTSLNNLEIDLENNHIKEIAGILDFADGEMTFQRFVRSEKHDFIGCLCKLGFLDKAIQYLKNELYPEPNMILSNSESSIIDAGSIGEGYINGCREIEEQPSILNIIKNTKNISPPILWAFTEIFILGDDRYLLDYSKAQFGILNNSENNYLYLIERAVRQFIVDFDENFQNKYLDYAKKFLSSSTYNLFISKLRYYNFDVNGIIKQKKNDNDFKIKKEILSKKKNRQKKDELYIPGIFGKQEGIEQMKEKISKVKKELKFNNNENAKLLIIEGLKNLQESGWIIWRNNFSKEINETFDILFSICESEDEFVFLIKDIILNEFFTSNWIVANKIIEIIGKKLNTNKTNIIFGIIIEHLKLMVRNDDKSISKYKIMNQIESNDSSTIQLSKLLIWFLNYPNYLIKEKTVEILYWLSNIESNIIIPQLINESLKDDNLKSSEISAGILHSLSIHNKNLVWNFINKSEDFKEKILSLKHFMIKASYFEMIKFIKDSGEKEKYFYNKLKQVFINSNYKQYIEINYFNIPVYIDKIKFYLDELNKIGLLDNNLLYKLINKNIEICSPLIVEEMSRCENYINRSFDLPIGFHQIFYDYLLSSLNQVILERITENNYFKIKNLLICYNLYFPDAHVDLNINNSISNKLDEIHSLNSTDYLKCIEFKNKILLHYYEHVENIEKNKFDSYEIEAILVEKENFKETLKEYYPVVKKIKFSIKFGGKFTPSILNPNFEKFLPNLNNSNFERKNWQIGRNLRVERFGMPVKEGCSILIQKEKIENIPTKFKMVWIFRFNYEETFLYDKEENKTYKI